MQAKREYRDRDDTEVAVLDALVDRTEEGMTVFELRTDVEVDIELTVRELADGTARFRGEPLRSGEPLAIDFGSVRTEGEILRISD